MADYSEFGGVAPEWEALHLAPEEPSDLSVEEVRSSTNREREEGARQYLHSIENVKWEDLDCPTTGGNCIPLRIYRSMSGTGNTEQPQPIYLWFHGGGFLFGTLATEDAFCARITAVTQMIVVNVCYRHTPEWKWPTQAEDAYAAVTWVFDHLDMLGADHRKVIVAGVSAGSLLAASSVIRYKRDQGKGHRSICGLILDIPLLGYTAKFPRHLIADGKCSLDTNKDAPLLPLSRLQWFEQLLGENALDDPDYNILEASDQALASLPPTHVQIAGRDILRDQGFLFVERLKQNQTKVTFNVYHGVPHGFRRYPSLPSSQKWFADHTAAIEELLSSNRHYDGGAS